MNQGEIARLYCDASYGLNGIFDTNDNENPESSEHEEEVGKRLVFEIELCYWHTPPPSPWALPSDEKFQEAEKHRAIGGNYFKMGKFRSALYHYSKIPDYMKGMEGLSEGAQLLAIAYNNKAACYLKLGSFTDGVLSCDKALLLHSDNVKALYRRGKCNLSLLEYKEAANDFSKAFDLDPKNESVIKGLQEAKNKLSKLTGRERDMYKRMF
eukprot:m.271154 g.271154  ORF g.271154 m.271154 type:complete len:211 (-) comp16267_c1_seq9:1265-1897(-)